MAADERSVLDLRRDGFVPDAGPLYAIGWITLIGQPGEPVATDGSLGSLSQALAEGKVTRFAIAAPERTPYAILKAMSVARAHVAAA